MKLTPGQLAAARLRERADNVDRFLADNESERDGWLSSMPVAEMRRDAEELRSTADVLDAQTEEIERLKAAATLNESPMEMVHVDEHRAIIDERDSLRSRLAESEAECQEQARLNGMGSEREARLMARLAEVEAERDEQGRLKAMLCERKDKLEQEVVRLSRQLAESQAREARLRKEIDELKAGR
jgi:DNA repair exonuclease SbcCD ATPase subunit